MTDYRSSGDLGELRGEVGNVSELGGRASLVANLTHDLVDGLDRLNALIGNQPFTF